MELTVYRVGFNGNDETEVDAESADEALELAKIIAKESGLHFALDYIVACPDGGQSYTAFLYLRGEHGVVATDISTHNNKTDAINFARLAGWDEVVNDNTGEVVWRR